MTFISSSLFTIALLYTTVIMEDQFTSKTNYMTLA